MSPKKRLSANKSLPERCRWDKNGTAIYYRPRDNERPYFDNVKSEFRLGSSKAGALRVLAERFARMEELDAVAIEYPTMSVLFDKYITVVTPKKSPGTQKTELQMIGKLRAVYGHMKPDQVTSQDIYKVTTATIEAIQKNSNGKLKGIATANHRNRKLSHVFTMGIKWGALKDHPMVNKQVVKEYDGGTSRYEPTDADFEKALPLAPEWLQCYCEIKLRVGLRMTDMLLLQLPQILDDRIRVRLSKTSSRSGKTLDIEMTDDLLHWVKKAIKAKEPRKLKSRKESKIPRVESMFLFHSRKGTPFINVDTYDTSSFASAWKRWQNKWAAAGGTRFQERMMRNKALGDLDLDKAQELAGHDDSKTTNIYRKTRPIRVSPVVRNIIK